MNLDNFEIKLCPSYELALKEPKPDITIEAEYGDKLLEGKVLTLAHHGERSGNPAPCNTNCPAFKSGTIIISHIDVDTLGGIMAVTGDKIKDPEFWAGAEIIDVYGGHHMNELSQEVQDKLNAISAWEKEHMREPFVETTDVKEIIRENYELFEKILNSGHPEHEAIIEKGREYGRNLEEENKLIESKLVFENEFVRVFRTDGVFCAANYYSPNQKIFVPATVSYNEKKHSITVGFRDGGRELGGKFSAREIVQSLWGPEAGGRDGIAGSPRGQEMSEEDVKNCLNKVVAIQTR